MNWNRIVLHFILCLLTCGLIVRVTAQIPCAFDQIREERLNQNPFLKAQRQTWEKISAVYPTQEVIPRLKITIPVVIHIVYFNDEQNISDDRVHSQIERLNQDFSGLNEDLVKVPPSFKHLIAKTGIQFCLANKDPASNPSSGIIRVPTSLDRIGTRIGSGGRRNLFYEELEGSEIWDSEIYLNIYVCDMGEIAGFASAPFTAIPEEDGVVINYRFFGANPDLQFGMGRVCTHEVGHFFDLNHTWGPSLDCEEDDGIDDTPRQMGPYFGCPAHPKVSCGSDDLFMNFMDYVDDSCMIMYTGGQKLRMLSALSGPRSKLTNSKICINPDTSRMENNITIFPNPVGNGPLIVQLNSHEDFICSWKLFTIDGRLISKSSENLSFLTSIPTHQLTPAMYILHIKTSKTNSVHKIFKSD